MPVCLEVTGISHGKLALTLKTSLNTNLANIFNSTLNAGLIVMILECFFEYYIQKFNFLLQVQQANCVHYLLHH